MKTTMLVLAALIAIVLLPSSAVAATCAEYTSQPTRSARRHARR